MPDSTQRVIISGAVLLLVACVCLALLVTAGVGVRAVEVALQPEPTLTRTPRARTPGAFPSPTRYSPPPVWGEGGALTPTSPGGESGSSTPAETQTPPPAEIPPEVARQMDEIEAQVIEIRGLAPLQEVPRVLLTRDQLRASLEQDLLQEYTDEEAAADALLYQALGLLPEGYDLRRLYLDLLSEEVAGFYDTDDKAMYVVQDDTFGANQRITYAHEYTHALQDQTYDIKNRLMYDDDFCQEDVERCVGLQALIEGDATLVQQLWLLRYSTDQDRRELLEMAQTYSSPTFDAAPAFIQQDFLFPYQTGAEFNQTLSDLGGWDAINAAYSDPPVSSEQVMHPDQYPEDDPTPVAIPDLLPALGEGWQKLREDTLGEWYTFLVLAYGREEAGRAAVDDARTATSGWEGDRYALYQEAGSGRVVMVLTHVWEGSRDAREFFSSMETAGRARWGKPGLVENNVLEWEAAGEAATLLNQGTTTLWVVGPDTATIRPVVEAVQAAIKAP